MPECKNYHRPCTRECSGATYCPHDVERPEYVCGNFCKMVFYGRAGWPHNSEWIVPGTITDEERV
jgi:hypothetical protein